jgi:GNAT superfamily N-acetyltransferase
MHLSTRSGCPTAVNKDVARDSIVVQSTLMPFMIEPAQAADIPVIQTVASASWHATYGHIFTRDFIERWLANAYDADALQGAIAWDRSIFLVAKAADQVVGFCQVGERSDQSFVLFRIYLAPTHWRQGLGGQLLAAAERWLRQQGATGYACYVHRQNEVGKAFYQKAGFVHDPPHDHEDEWYLWKSL